LPVVYRWAYDYSVPGVADDYIPQTMPSKDVVMEDGSTGNGQGEDT
jgi:cytochrome c oxidase subunit 1